MCVYVRPQAVATWLCANYTFSQAPPGRRTLRANFDEAAVCLFQGTGQGHVLPLKTDPAVQHVPIARRRTLCYLLSSGDGVLAIHGNHAHRDPPVAFYNEKQNKNTNGIVFEFSLFIVFCDELVRCTGCSGINEIGLELMELLRN